MLFSKKLCIAVVTLMICCNTMRGMQPQALLLTYDREKTPYDYEKTPDDCYPSFTIKDDTEESSSSTDKHSNESNTNDQNKDFLTIKNITLRAFIEVLKNEEFFDKGKVRRKARGLLKDQGFKHPDLLDRNNTAQQKIATRNTQFFHGYLDYLIPSNINPTIKESFNNAFSAKNLQHIFTGEAISLLFTLAPAFLSSHVLLPLLAIPFYDELHSLFWHDPSSNEHIKHTTINTLRLLQQTPHIVTEQHKAQLKNIQELLGK